MCETVRGEEGKRVNESEKVITIIKEVLNFVFRGVFVVVVFLSVGVCKI